MRYLWENEKTPDYPALPGDLETGVLVIGGGMAGVLCAYRLTQAGADCVLVEGDVPGTGTTRGPTAVLTAQHDTLYSDLVRKQGAAAARDRRSQYRRQQGQRRTAARWAHRRL